MKNEMFERRKEDRVKCKGCLYYQFVKYPDGTDSPSGWCTLNMNRVHKFVLFFCDKYYDKNESTRIESKGW